MKKEVKVGEVFKFQTFAALVLALAHFETTLSVFSSS